MARILQDVDVSQIDSINSGDAVSVFATKAGTVTLGRTGQSLAIPSTITTVPALNVTGTLDIDATGNLSINSSAGVLNFGNDNVSQNINVGTQGARTITVGNTSGATAVVVNSGTGGIALTGGLTSVDPVASKSLHATTAYTYTAAGGAFSPTAAQLLGGFIYNGAAGGAVALQMPAIADVQTALAADNITTASGLTLVHSFARVTDANNLTVTAGAGGTVTGVAAVNTSSAVIITVFTGAATATHYVIPT